MNTRVFSQFSLLATVLATFSFSVSCSGSSSKAEPDARGDILVNNVRLYTKLRPTTITTYGPDGSVTSIETNTFERRSNSETVEIEFFPNSPEPIFVKRSNRFNQGGQLIGVETFPNEFERPGELRSSLTTYTYSDQQVENILSDSKIQGVREKLAEVRYEFDSAGRVIKADEFLLPANVKTWSATRVYDDTGWVTVKTEGETVTTRTVQLNSSGRVFRTDVETVESGVMAPGFHIEYKYDGVGNLVESAIVDDAGNITSRTTLEDYTDIGTFYHDSLQLVISFDLGSNS